MSLNQISLDSILKPQIRAMLRIRIRIGSGFNQIRSESGSRRAKITLKN
jgi:hypothetical protein